MKLITFHIINPHPESLRITSSNMPIIFTFKYPKYPNFSAKLLKLKNISHLFVRRSQRIQIHFPPIHKHTMNKNNCAKKADFKFQKLLKITRQNYSSVETSHRTSCITHNHDHSHRTLAHTYTKARLHNAHAHTNKQHSSIRANKYIRTIYSSLLSATIHVNAYVCRDRSPYVLTKFVLVCMHCFMKFWHFCHIFRQYIFFIPYSLHYFTCSICITSRNKKKKPINAKTPKSPSWMCGE